jgi:purine nucleosidase
VIKRLTFVLVAMLACVCVSTPAAMPAVQREDGRHHARPVIHDMDADFDDTVALAALAEQHLQGRIDLRAVTVTNNGAGLPSKAFQHVRCLLNSLGLDNIPVADATYDLPHAFPDSLRHPIDSLLDASIPDCPAGHVLPDFSAGELLANEIEKSEGDLTLITTGPLTNVAVALDLLDRRHQGRAADLIDRVYVMGGAVHVPGGLNGVPGFDNTQELNIWGDPVAAQTVFTRLAGAVHLVALDATNFVPIRAEYIALITANQQTAATRYVATLMNQPVIAGAIKFGLPIFWWDPTAALSANHSRLVEFRWDRIAVVQDGVSSGRTIETPSGAWIRVGVSADTALFESTLLNVLNGVDSRP